MNNVPLETDVAALAMALSLDAQQLDEFRKHQAAWGTTLASLDEELRNSAIVSETDLAIRINVRDDE